MRFIAHYAILIFLVMVSFSCEDQTIMYYHTPETPINSNWLLDSVTYLPNNSQNGEIVVRKDIAISYTDGGLVKTIDNKISSNLITIDYKDEKKISFSKFRENGSYYYDSLLVTLNEKKYAVSALHVTYEKSIMGKVSAKNQTQNDSTYFTYDRDGYLIQLDRYSSVGQTMPTYWEKHTIQNGNIVKIITSKNYEYTYIYDQIDNIAATGYCYEMPYNTISLNQGGCWLLSSLVFVSDYLGKKNKNNIVRAVITKMSTTGSEQMRYADLTYDYTYNNNKLLSKVTVSGTVNGKALPANYSTSFFYKRKTTVIK